MRVLMLGWEFPPFISGGLGTACHGLTRAMNRLGVEVLFVLPTSTDTVEGGDWGMQSVSATESRNATASAGVAYERVAAQMPNPYATTAGPSFGSTRRSRHVRRPRARNGRLRVLGTGDGQGYGGDLLGRIEAYARRCERLVGRVAFDVVHAHDWMTFPAAQRLAALSGRPMIAHVHATEFDRSGTQVNQCVYDIERAGMHSADVVIAVSHRTRQMLLERYGVNPEKVRVVHNGIEPVDAEAAQDMATRQRYALEKREKVVLFLGRLTMQKGPMFFIHAAVRVLERFQNVKFVVAGWGDLAPRMIEEVASRGLGHKVLFVGFLRGRAVDHAFQEADVYVMPSVSEPFGLTALEAIRNGAPVVLSRSTGVAEVLDGCALQMDCWDVNKMADHIVSLLSDPGLAATVRGNAAARLGRLTWDPTAQQCVSLYEEALVAQGIGENAADGVGVAAV